MFQIAICDDIPAIFQTVRGILITHPCYSEMHISEFLNGEDLCDSLKCGRVYGLLILDIELPCMNGVHLGQFLRHELQNHDTQILYISGHTKYVQDLFESHPLNFLTKPINPAKLLNCVDDAMRRAALHQPTFPILLSSCPRIALFVFITLFWCIKALSIICTMSLSYWTTAPNYPLARATINKCARTCYHCLPR